MPVMPVMSVMPVIPVMLRANGAAANRSGSMRRVGVRIGDAIVDAAHGLAESGSIQTVRRTGLCERRAG